MALGGYEPINPTPTTDRKVRFQPLSTQTLSAKRQGVSVLFQMSIAPAGSRSREPEFHYTTSLINLSRKKLHKYSFFNFPIFVIFPIAFSVGIVYNYKCQGRENHFSNGQDSATEIVKKNPKKFSKPLDKRHKVCYNKYITQREVQYRNKTL